MTLIETLATNAFVQQAADRLVTTSGGVYDPLANKTIVYFGGDAVATIGYSGVAYLDGLPTDTVIASVFAGEDLASVTGMRMAPLRVEHRDVGLIVAQLQERLRIAYRRLPAANQSYPHEVVVAGYQFHPRAGGLLPFCEPFVWKIRGHGDDWTTTRSSWSSRFHLVVTPTGSVTAAEANRLFDQLEASGPDLSMTGDPIAESVRDVAARTAAAGAAVIGRHVMVVTMPKPAPNACLRIRFAPESGVPPQAQYGSFCPWVVSPAVIWAPNDLGTGWTFETEFYRVELVGPSGFGGTTGFSAVRRRPPPGRT